MFLPNIHSIARNIDRTGWWCWLVASDGIRTVEPLPLFVQDLR